MLHLAIAIGGLFGALARHGLGLGLTVAGDPTFPWGTLAANLAGSWLLGFLMQVLPATMVSPAVRAGLTIGFCAGFTTFSTFAWEAMMLVREGEPVLAAAYVVGSVLLSLTALMAGRGTGLLLTRYRSRPQVAPAPRPDDRGAMIPAPAPEREDRR